MAPNKKKKKTANPARGFATSSVASKHRIEPENEPEHVEVAGTTILQQPPAPIASQTTQVDTHQLSPEELEAHLEQAELQRLVDKFDDKVTRQASRHAARLDTERRLWRSQAENEVAPNAVPADIFEQISQALPQDDPVGTKFERDWPALSQDDKLCLVWQLHELLCRLSFSIDVALDALRHFVSVIPTRNLSKDLSVELQICLDWLGRRNIEMTALDYDTVAAPVIPEPESEPEEVPVEKPVPEPIDEEIEDESDAESDLEPDQMLVKYLEYQSRMYQIDPTLARAPQGQPTKKQRQKQKENQLSAASNDSRTFQRNRQARRLHGKIQKLQSDMLFDQEAADNQWAAQRLQLEIDAAAQKRFQIKQPPVVVEEDLAIDALFIEDVEESPEPASANLREFGPWTGTGPRRILEDVCRARDPMSTVKFSELGRAYTSRQSVVIEWSKKQDLNVQNPETTIQLTRRSKRVRLDMVDVSCPNKGQAEAYIATVALFALFAQSPKEERLALRLPTVWKTVWSELVALRKETDDVGKREVVRRLREIIEQSTVVAPSASTVPAETVNGHKEDVPTKDLKTAMIDRWQATALSPAYHEYLGARRSLPVWGFKAQILQAVAAHPVVILCGQTGCGKSTQVPAYIMENELAQGRSCKIYCTEPRRISAISLARRVSEELGERKADVGTARSLVGFAIRLESKMVDANALIYATTGVVMRMLERSHGLAGITHLVLDEVHERSIDSDFLLIILRRILQTRPDLRVILMSATVDAEKFSRYLGQAPIIEVPGRTFPVQALHLEDAIEFCDFAPTQQRDHVDDVDFDAAACNLDLGCLKHYKPQTIRTLTALDEYRIPYDLIVALVERLSTPDYASFGQAVLVFLPGIAEIRRMQRILLDAEMVEANFEIFALHSALATEDQERAFLRPSRRRAKIVLATNIAETGITIPDITCVIDTGKHKEMRFDERRQLSRLIESFISQANALQRRGRAGRVQEGLCFHLFTRQRFAKMNPEQIPEMLRLSLQDLVLRVKTCGMGGIEETLSEALDPPAPKNIYRAISALQDVKALTPLQNLTALGGKLARLPCDVFLGKLLLLGSIFGCLDASLTIAATLSSKSPFTATLANQARADEARLAFSRGHSDLLTVYNVYGAWKRIRTGNGMSEAQFCQRNFLSMQSLANIEDLKGQLLSNLCEAGFVTMAGTHRGRRQFVETPEEYNVNNETDEVVNAVIAASFYPKLLRRVGNGWQSVGNNQALSLHASSVNKRVTEPSKWLSFHHIMAGTSGKYNAHETSAVHDLGILLLCGEAEFKLYAGVMTLDGNRARFVFRDWRMLLVLQKLRSELQAVVDYRVRHPQQALTEAQTTWLASFGRVMGDLRHRQ